MGQVRQIKPGWRELGKYAPEKFKARGEWLTFATKPRVGPENAGEKFAKGGRFGYNYNRIRGVAQPGSALEWGSSGRRFKSGRPD